MCGNTKEHSEAAENKRNRKAENSELAGNAASAAKIAELKESVASLLDNMPALTFSKDVENGKYLACNQQFAGFAHKKSPVDVIGLTAYDIFDEATARHFEECDKRALSMDKPYVYVENVLDAGGNPWQLQTTKLKFTDAAGRLCLLGMCLDLTEMMAMKQETARAQEAYEKARSDSATYSNIVRALSADYTFLYYVNVETDRFVEYSVGRGQKELAEKRRQDDFFNASRQDALQMLHPGDQDNFIRAFTKENILRSINEHGTFTFTYRLLVDGAPAYVNMKATRMEGDEKHIIIGVNNVDAQMKMQEEAARIQEERTTYSRITALSGGYIGIYTVDPVTDYYEEYSATRDYEGLGIAKKGEDFFGHSRKEIRRLLYPEDLDRVLSMLTKENVMREIEENGVFELTYRLMINGTPTYVSLKVAMVEEKGGKRLIAGVSNIDARMRREQEYAKNLIQARNQANRDALTGVKNKHAYADTEAQLDQCIKENRPVEFAVSIFDLNGLKKVNDTQGHQAGDQYIRKGCQIICNIYKHSPVFRIGGDEFAVISQGDDYKNVENLLKTVEELNEKNAAAGDVTLAGGMSRYCNDSSVADVFKRADARMYENKIRFKNIH